MALDILLKENSELFDFYYSKINFRVKKEANSIINKPILACYEQEISLDIDTARRLQKELNLAIDEWIKSNMQLFQQ